MSVAVVLAVSAIGTVKRKLLFGVCLSWLLPEERREGGDPCRGLNNVRARQGHRLNFVVFLWCFCSASTWLHVQDPVAPGLIAHRATIRRLLPAS